jgi:UDP-N-acetylglucosamine--N-acetylmuramyl-(pentapeptide) pyrophosphoryl-undecaprenol N-acetylglucosamine transferase
VKVVLSGGGTGGHVYPALAVASALRRELGEDEELGLLYVGTRGRAEDELVAREGIPFEAVRAGALRGRSPWAMARSLFNLVTGTVQAFRILGRVKPQVVFATGGYASVPVGVATWRRRLPLVVYLPDVRPGWAVKLLARLARRVVATTDASLPYLPAPKTTVTGYPVRHAFFDAGKEEARRRLGLDPDRKTLLVSGATLGAHTINQAIAGNLPRLLELCQIIHIAGATDAEWLRQVEGRLPDESRARYHLYSYLYEEMPSAMAAADLAVMRSGASCLGELPAVGLPAVLVPYPHAGQHQRWNAHYLVEQGAAIELQDQHLPLLFSTVQALLANDMRREAMAAAMRRLARPEAAREVARVLIEAAA